MAAKDDGESAREEGDQRIVDLALEAGYKGVGKGKWSLGKGLSLNEKGYQVGKGDKEWETHGKRAVARKEAKGKRKMAMETPEHVGHVARQDTLQRGVEKEVTKIVRH